jgi:hypothetical protein
MSAYGRSELAIPNTAPNIMHGFGGGDWIILTNTEKRVVGDG